MQISTVYLSTLTLALTTIVTGNAFNKKKQFYPSVVYITKSNTSMAVIYVQFFVMVFVFGKLLRKIFLGTLRSTEFEHLLERFWYALTETCLAFTVFRDDFNPRFVALFTVLLFLKSFHWLAEERVDFMERSPVLGWLFHARVLSLLVVLGFMDYWLLLHAYNSTIIRGPTVQLVFGFEYGILLTVIASIGIKYLLHAAEMQTENPWENKAVFLLYTELIIGLIKVLLYVLFVVIMAKIYALPMFVFRPMFFTIRSFKKALSDVIMSRRAIRNMNTLYPDATPEELRLSDNICIICREDMVANSKKLPCGHIFHTSCLRSWFQRQQTCPTCRLNILHTTTENPPAPREEGAALPNAQPIDPAGRNRYDETNQNAGGFANVFRGPMQIPQSPLVVPSPIPFLAHFSVPPPTMPPNLSILSDEELRAMEGNERRNIEERLKVLGNIKLLLDASTVLMNQYTLVTAYNSTTEREKVVDPNAAATTSTDNNPAPSTTTNIESKPPLESEKDIVIPETSISDVKIEDIGGEDDLNDANKNEEDVDDTDSSGLSELRKRRLKYLHGTTTTTQNL
ncbi:E3 ubiquitin-protein ligase HRD1 [Episyrphus balteatus]|uniref:E3 ubiquitin-protein ligase HRD1 n=1 Tax=Episyrphus balteatus TaxID=286459 RepID=UPI002485F6D2|nr:E3 ubiquitin-protein ligase HRD1 [Episyrphus balteatus]